MKRRDHIAWEPVEAYIQQGGYVVLVQGGGMTRLLLELNSKETYAERPVAQDAWDEAYARLYSPVGDFVPDDMFQLLLEHKRAIREAQNAH